VSRPPPKEKGAVDAVTPATPKRDPHLSTGKKNSGRKYTLDAPEVNAQPPIAEPRVSEAGKGGAQRLPASLQAYLEICAEETGKELPPEVLERRTKDRELLLMQSHRIAEALESEGIKAYGPAKLCLLGICSGEVVELPDFRNIVFIPAVAQRKRHPMVKTLEYFLQKHPYSRMWVFTTGTRTPLGEVRDRAQWLHRRLSKLNAQPFMKAAGVSLVFRSTELGEIDKDESGTPTFHVHAHVMVQMRRWLPKDVWTQLLENVRDWWTYHFDESKKIEKVREACKYVVKPGDLDQLTAPELAELHHQLFRLHLVQCLGELKELRKTITESRKKLVRRSQGNGSRLVLADDWNPSPQKKEKIPDKTPELPESPLEDWVLTTLPPSSAVSSRAEPLAVVLNYTGGRIHDNRRLRLIREKCSDRFNGGAP